ncbi:unnamed protein product [Symbiodinium natans]|uniref:Uncharacterized protein n=1 Tax=Symbiodinium natans TaxID=878477 RepID=A0A812MK78_9DINO|nr:unnamed protein product [Symbiodinium natans]
MLQTGRSGLELVLLLVGLVGVSSHEVVDMCGQLRDGLGAVACADVLQWGAKGFRLTGTLTEPLRYAGLGFDDNIAGGATPGAMNVCMLAAFGNGGVIPESCVPTTGTAADEWNGRPEIHYFGMLGFDCGFNFRAFAAGESINWDFPTGNTCVGDVDLDVGLTSLTCMFDMACELGTTTNHDFRHDFPNRVLLHSLYIHLSNGKVDHQHQNLDTNNPHSDILYVIHHRDSHISDPYLLNGDLLTDSHTDGHNFSNLDLHNHSNCDCNETELCLEVPLVQNSADLTYCWGLPHGSACDVRCADGYARDANASLAVCQDGVWQIQGECLREGLEVVQSAAVQVLLQVSLDLPKASNYSTSLRWAQTHEDALYWAFARTLAVHPSELRLELQPAALPGSRAAAVLRGGLCRTPDRAR